MRLSLVVPCYNEAAVLAGSVQQLRQVLETLRDQGKVEAASNLWLIDDGSSDDHLDADRAVRGDAGRMWWV